LAIVLFDTPRSRRQLYPLSLTKPIADIRHGIFSPREWYAKVSARKVYAITESYLEESLPEDGPWYCIDASVVPELRILEALDNLSTGEMLEDENGLIAYLSATKPNYDNLPLFFQSSKKIDSCRRIQHPMDLVRYNAEKIKEDFGLINPTDATVQLRGQNQIFGHHPVAAAAGVRIAGCIINTEEGPLYLGENCYVMEGALLRGPVSLGKNSVVKMGAQLYGGTTIGQKAVAGGEIKNSILGDYSNKAHHGYFGDSVVGEWCNLGAGTTNSNVKNNAGLIKMWSEEKRDYIPIGKKAGFVMGDFSKTAINTTINSGSTIGVGTSLHLPGYPEKRVPSFAWGPGEKYLYAHLIEDIQAWYSFKNIPMDEKTASIIEYLFHLPKPV
jgi:UDP-N-acetylglucosamine diphosphorylase / glucose-1-phosphate thymidylyltransferase / UDP-N-acetylgalactosamine diphosphorylase / glucosamine-1-phosphate N-acetyltransferase / galactosamine-1-phosphate N-acetyltransferase